MKKILFFVLNILFLGIVFGDVPPMDINYSFSVSSIDDYGDINTIYPVSTLYEDKETRRGKLGEFGKVYAQICKENGGVRITRLDSNDNLKCIKKDGTKIMVLEDYDTCTRSNIKYLNGKYIGEQNFQDTIKNSGIDIKINSCVLEVSKNKIEKGDNKYEATFEKVCKQKGGTYKEKYCGPHICGDICEKSGEELENSSIHDEVSKENEKNQISIINESKILEQKLKENKRKIENFFSDYILGNKKYDGYCYSKKRGK